MGGSQSKVPRVGLCPLFVFRDVFAGVSRISSTVTDARLARVRETAERVARSYGLEIFDVQLRREAVGLVLRVVIDKRTGGTTEDDSVGIVECQHVSHDLSAILDVEEEALGEPALGQAYTLEVSSPGLDRPLRHEADYRRFTGRLAKVVTKTPVNGQTAFAGRLSGVEDGMVLLEEGRKVHRVPLADIKRGRLEVEF